MKLLGFGEGGFGEIPFGGIPFSGISSSTILLAIIGALTARMKMNNGTTTSETTKLLQDISNEIATKWKDWATSVKFGGVAVSGAGIGTWVGTGSGGVFSKTITIKIPYTYDTVNSKKMIDSLNTRITAAFNQWINSFTFSGVSYNGTSTATSSSPGAYNVINVPMSLSSSGTVAKFQTLANDIKGDLNFEKDSIADDLFTAIQNTVKDQFDSWRNESKITNNSATGTAASGAGTGSGNSLNDGVIA
jgi:hypothetical protein